MYILFFFKCFTLLSKADVRTSTFILFVAVDENVQLYLKSSV